MNATNIALSKANSVGSKPKSCIFANEAWIKKLLYFPEELYPWEEEFIPKAGKQQQYQ